MLSPFNTLHCPIGGQKSPRRRLILQQWAGRSRGGGGGVAAGQLSCFDAGFINAARLIHSNKDDELMAGEIAQLGQTPPTGHRQTVVLLDPK